MTSFPQSYRCACGTSLRTSLWPLRQMLPRTFPRMLPRWIGVGTAHWFAPPLPPNRTGGSPTRLSSCRQFYLTRIKISMTGTQKAPMQICLKGLCPWSADVLGQSVPRPLSFVMDELPTARIRMGKGTENSSPRLSPYGQSRGLKPHPHTNTASPFLHPLAPRALPSFLANTPGSRKPLADLVLSPVSRSGLHLERAGSS